MNVERSAPWARDLAVVVGVKALADAIVWASGFRAVSDDDFARVVLAQEWAAHPKLDPTGTSWLPFPFWLTGAVMRWSGDTSLACARAVSIALGFVSACLVLAAARLLVRDRRAALAGALVACAFPWSARLGVATVPELPTAALSFFAVATLASSRVHLRLAGGAALLLAAWSRYEPWPLAFAFVVVQLLPRAGVAPLALGARLKASLLALVAPALWIAHNARVHGDPLHFVARVSAYKRAVGGEDPWAIVGYPLALVREEPELWLVLGACLLVRRARVPSTFRPVVLTLTAMVVALSLAAARGGAPTHHNGRAILAVWLAVAVAVGAWVAEALSKPGRARLFLAAAIALALPLGGLVLRPWYARLDRMADRGAEIRIGEQVRAHATRGPVLLEVRDFGFFAVQAGSGTPGLFVLDRTLDPRDPAAGSSFHDEATLAAKLESTGARYVVATPCPATLPLGEPLATAGSWALWAVLPKGR